MKEIDDVIAFKTFDSDTNMNMQSSPAASLSHLPLCHWLCSRCEQMLASDCPAVSPIYPTHS